MKTQKQPALHRRLLNSFYELMKSRQHDRRLFALLEQRNNGDDEVGNSNPDKDFFCFTHIHHPLSEKRSRQPNCLCVKRIITNTTDFNKPAFLFKEVFTLDAFIFSAIILSVFALFYYQWKTFRDFHERIKADEEMIFRLADSTTQNGKDILQLHAEINERLKILEDGRTRRN